MKKIKAFFFDRDGVVNWRIVNDYIKNIDQFKFLPDFIDFFPKIINAGFDTFLVTNQQGVGKQIMTEKQLFDLFNFMQNQLEIKTGAAFKDIFYCTDLADSNSSHRKPNPGMILDAINKWNIDPEVSYIIGDSLSDAQAGKKVGLKTILIGDHSPDDADYIVKNLFGLLNSLHLLK